MPILARLRIAVETLVALDSAQAQAVSVYSNVHGRDCYLAAEFGDPHGKGVVDCTAALFDGMSSVPALWWLVNRGFIQLGHKNPGPAIVDFNDVIKNDNAMGDAYADRGAAEIALRQFSAGRDDIDHGLTLGAEEPQKFYYNRGIADEYLGDETTAYHDFTKASQIDPQWIWPKTELARFTVVPK
jgi:hypothetical protein